mgnify:CR=1 FL=1
MRFENAPKRNQICPTRFRDERDLATSRFLQRKEKQKPAHYGWREAIIESALRREKEGKKKEEKKREKKSGKSKRKKEKEERSHKIVVTQNMDDDKQNKKNSNANPFFFALKDANGCYPPPGRPP